MKSRNESKNTGFKIAYTIVTRGEKKYWVKVGAAFRNRDGSWNIRLDAIPVNGELQLRDRRDPDELRKGGAGSGLSPSDFRPASRLAS